MIFVGGETTVCPTFDKDDFAKPKNLVLVKLQVAKNAATGKLALSGR